jgi:ferrous iron transport protein A
MKNEKKLSELLPGECGVVHSVCGGEMHRRFMDIGLLPKTRVVCLGESPLGDPCAYLVRGKTVAIRRCDAGQIKLRTEE